MRRARALAVSIVALAAACDPPPAARARPRDTSAARGGASAAHVASSTPSPVPTPASPLAARGLSDEARAFYLERREEYAAERLLAVAERGRVSRAGGVLTLQLAGGRRVSLADTIVDGGAFRRFVYAGHLRDLGVHVVEVTFYEGGEYRVFHDRTGQEVTLAGAPIPSPDGTRFAVASVDLHAGYDPNVLEVWRVTPAGMTREYAIDGGDRWGPADVSWDGFARLRFVQERLADSVDGGEDTVRTPSSLVRVEGRWGVER